MKKNPVYIVLVIISIILVIGTAVYLLGPSKTSSPTSVQPTQLKTPTQALVPTSGANTQESQGEGVMITYTDSGYSPGIVTISAGTLVSFENRGSQPMWTASAIHPNHRMYPGTDITQCNSAVQKMMFDACGAVASGKTWSFKFDNKGEWGYHNHLNPSHRGKVIVE